MCNNLKLSSLLILSLVLLGPIRTHPMVGVISSPSSKKVQEGNDKEKAKSERNSNSKYRGVKKKLNLQIGTNT